MTTDRVRHERHDEEASASTQAADDEHRLARGQVALPSKEVQSHPISEQIADIIRRGEIGPGQRFPSERNLAIRFGVSRPAIREALRGLERSRIIQIKDRSGAYVMPFHPDQLVTLDIMLLAGHIDDTDLLHAVEVRRVVETALAELAASRCTAVDLAALADNIERMRLAVANDDDTVPLDIEFHGLVAETAANPVFARMLESISQLLWRSREITSRTPAGPGKALAFHLGIYQALEARDPVAARHAMEVHLDDVETLLRQELGRDDPARTKVPAPLTRI
jgi:GntR family transcriptional repressor for pyruvate dehydrogenase complex